MFEENENPVTEEVTENVEETTEQTQEQVIHMQVGQPTRMVHQEHIHLKRLRRLQRTLLSILTGQLISTQSPSTVVSLV